MRLTINECLRMGVHPTVQQIEEMLAENCELSNENDVLKMKLERVYDILELPTIPEITRQRIIEAMK